MTISKGFHDNKDPQNGYKHHLAKGLAESRTRSVLTICNSLRRVATNMMHLMVCFNNGHLQEPLCSKEMMFESCGSLS